MSGLFVSQPLSTFQLWPDLEQNQDSPDLPEERLDSLTPSMLSPTSPWETFFSCHPPPWNPPSFSVKLTFFCPCSRYHPLLFGRGAALANLDSFPPRDLVIWTDGSVLFLFGKGGSAVLVNCSLCNTEANISFSAGLVCCFFAEACALVQAHC